MRQSRSKLTVALPSFSIVHLAHSFNGQTKKTLTTNMIVNKVIALFTFISICLAVKGSSTSNLILQSLQHANHVIPITNANLSIVSGPRDYWTLISFTSTDEKHACTTCHDFERVLAAVSNSWWADYAQSLFNLFFLNVDIIDRSNIPIFELLEFNTIPHIWLILPNTDIDIAEEDDEGYQNKILHDGHFVFKLPVAAVDEQIMEFARFVTETTQKSILVRTEDPTMKFIKTFALTFIVILVLKKKGPTMLKNINKKYFSAAFFIFLILSFICGYAFTTTLGVPFLATGGKGEMIYISGGILYQFGIEIVIVGANYFFLGLSLLSLIYLGHYKVGSGTVIENERIHFLLVVVNSLVVFFLYSLLTSIFLRKDHSYPYGLAKLI